MHANAPNVALRSHLVDLLVVRSGDDVVYKTRQEGGQRASSFDSGQRRRSRHSPNVQSSLAPRRPAPSANFS